MNKIGLYLHIPFCLQKCLYCDFPSYDHLEHLYADYTTALCREIAAQGGVFSEYIVDTMYIGGGTPTVLPLVMLERIIDELHRRFHIDRDAEISMEANPGTIDKEKLFTLRSSGINRISFGIQAFNDRLLKLIGRVHTVAEGEQAVRFAQEAGFDNINIDLMYGLPNQSVDDMKDSLKRGVTLGIQHISAYGLQVEEGTGLARSLSTGCLTLPEEEREEEMYDLVMRYLPEQGYARYEISNFALPGLECRHNLKYWQYQPYIGLGAAAHSFVNGKRRENWADVAKYIYHMGQNQSPVKSTEVTDLRVARAEFVFLALRTVRGLQYSEFKECFGVEFMSCFGEIVQGLSRKQLIIIRDTYICLTSLGMKYGNVVFRSFLP